MSAAQPAIFSTLGILSVSQEISGLALSIMNSAEAELVAEESICLLAVASARTVEAIAPEEADLASSLMIAPFLYRDYLIGAAMVESGDHGRGEEGVRIGERLERKIAFYAAHLRAGELPTGSVLKNAMLLWMGRISPPRMPSGPEDRLDEIEATAKVSCHLKLIAAHLKQSRL
ncbi:MAG: hypothetical protein O3B41_07420 [Bacteroidetes bacterium]|nr:hypothetical protein [Bacteroidota bacterium]